MSGVSVLRHRDDESRAEDLRPRWDGGASSLEVYRCWRSPLPRGGRDYLAVYLRGRRFNCAAQRRKRTRNECVASVVLTLSAVSCSNRWQRSLHVYMGGRLRGPEKQPAKSGACGGVVLLVGDRVLYGGGEFPVCVKDRAGDVIPTLFTFRKPDFGRIVAAL